MDSSTRIFIDNLAEAVIDAYGITIPIDNIEDVVKKIGGEIVEKADLDDLYDGTIYALICSGSWECLWKKK